MKIAISSLYLPSGSKIGVGYQVHGLANALTRKGHDVTVFSPCPATIDALYRVELVTARKQVRTFGFAWDLRRIDFGKFDVLNAHGDDWFLWGVRRPWHIHTYHGSCLAEMLNIQGIKAKLRMGLLAVCETQVGLLADQTVSVSESTRRFIPGIRHVIPCGVAVDAFHPGREKASSPTILFVGTMHGRKRGRFLLELFSAGIRTAIPDAELWCVCDRPSGISESPGVRWLGRVTEEALCELYRQAWVFCLPSSYEGFGVPYIEAMASGTPVVASPNVGALEVTQNGKSGVIAADRELGREIIRLLGDEEARNALAAKGLKRAGDFSWPTVCQRYEELYFPS